MCRYVQQLFNQSAFAHGFFNASGGAALHELPGWLISVRETIDASLQARFGSALNVTALAVYWTQFTAGDLTGGDLGSSSAGGVSAAPALASAN